MSGKTYIDVTETLKVPFTTGIQRVVKEFTRRLIHQDDNIKLLRHIAGTEDYQIVTAEEFDHFCEYGKAETKENDEIITLDFLRKPDLFLDLDSVWNKLEERRQNVYERLHAREVSVATLVYDILPITHPQFFNEDTLWHFLLYLSAVLTYSDIIIVNSEATKHRIEELSIYPQLPTKKIVVVPLGADFKNIEFTEKDVSQNIIDATQSPYLLMLGTLEPRKNHALLLDAFDQGLSDQPINIIIAGRKGWNIDALLERIESHPLSGSRVFFIESPSDKEVAYLYQHAYGLVFASFGEGFGLPLIEALYYKKLIFASDIEVFHEVGGDLCLYFNPHDPQSLIHCVSQTLSEQKLAETYREKVRQYHIVSWDEAVIPMIHLIRDYEETENHVTCPEAQKKPSQMYMITAREDDLLTTLPFFEHFMPFIREVVIGCPERLVSVIRNKYQGNLKLSFLTDEVLLNGQPIPKDHQIRNFLLRSLAIQQPIIDDVFIMADDDNRPLRTIPVETFIKDGKFKLYYCNEDVRTWQPYIGGATSYDKGIRNTAGFLQKNELSYRQYSSHAPQIICKRIFTEALQVYPEVLGSAIDEWSFYGNYAMTYYQDFFDSVPYVTMCWPAMSTDWKVTVPPKEYLFENFYEVLYQEGGVFQGFSTVYHDGILEENIRKIQLRLAEQNQYEAGMAVNAVYDAIYRETFQIQPDWEINLDQLTVRAPMILMGRRGFVQKAPIRIVNTLFHKRLRIGGYFEEQNTGVHYSFQHEDLDLSEINGNYELNIHFPKIQIAGMLILELELDEQDQCNVKIPVVSL